MSRLRSDGLGHAPSVLLHQPPQHLQAPAGENVGAGTLQDGFDGGEGGPDQGVSGVGWLSELGLDVG